MLKLFPLPPFLERFARRRIVNVAIFGNGISTMEWAQLNSTHWHHHAGFSVHMVDSPAEADILAVHGPLTAASWPYFERWMSEKAPHAKVIVIGAEMQTRAGFILGPTGVASAYNIDAILPGHPPGPNELKASIAALSSEVTSV